MYYDYSLLLRFVKTHAKSGFKDILESNLNLIEVERMMEDNVQFFYIADLIDLKILYTSLGSLQMIGVKHELVSPKIFMEVAHPEEFERSNLGRNLLIKKAEEILHAGKGQLLFSSNFRMRNPDGGYDEILNQSLLFFSRVPYKTVYLLKIHTNINGFKKFSNKYHFYVGNDLSNFRYPDQDLLDIGIELSPREFEIVLMIKNGLSSEKIGKELFLSTLTVNTHRRNILNKTGKQNMNEVIKELSDKGAL